MIERHQDYQLTIATVPVGGLTNVPLQLDTDAPFALRLVRSRNIGASGWRFKTPRLQYQSSELRTDLTLNPSGLVPGGTRPSRGVIIYPQMIYPPGSSIICDIGNATLAPITNARLLFRGSKLFADGAISAPTYPQRMGMLPFVYPPFTDTFGGFIRVPALTATLRDNQLRVVNDSDFVLRYGICNPFTLVIDGQPTAFGSFVEPVYRELYVQLKDESRKAYSNEPIHVNDLFGQMFPSPFPTAAGAVDDQALWMPGLFTPEIYLPRDHALYFDIIRSDTALAGSTPLDLHFAFQGAKVFNR